jgi:AcrR family transcriptional regulator
VTGHRSLKEKQRQERENLILQATEELLLEKGYYDMSMDDIAARVGIAKGTLYLHFAKKEDLMLAFFEFRLQEIKEMFKQNSMIEGSAQEKLEAIVHQMYQGLSSGRRQFLSILHSNSDLRTRLKEKQADVMHEITRILAGVFEDGKESGDFDASLPTEVMLHAFFIMLSPRNYGFLTSENEVPTEAFLHGAERLFFRGIGARSFPQV